MGKGSPEPSREATSAAPEPQAPRRRGRPAGQAPRVINLPALSWQEVLNLFRLLDVEPPSDPSELPEAFVRLRDALS